MAAASSSASSASTVDSVSSLVSKSCALFSSSSQVPSIKLDRGNYLLWESVLLSLIEGNQLESHIDGSNPALPRFLTSEVLTVEAGVVVPTLLVAASVVVAVVVEVDVKGARTVVVEDLFAISVKNMDMSYLIVITVLTIRFNHPSGRTLPSDGSGETPFPLLITAPSVGNNTELCLGSSSVKNAPTGSSPRAQITPTVSPLMVRLESRVIASTNSETPLSDAHDTARDANSSTSLNPSQSSSLGPAHEIHSEQAQISERIEVLPEVQAQRPHPMDLGPLYYFLGIEIYRDSSGIFLNQSKYVQDLLSRFQMSDCAPVSTPMVTGKQFSKDEGEPLSNLTLYQQAVGSLQYLTTTRPNISYSVNKLSQYMANPTDPRFSTKISLMSSIVLPQKWELVLSWLMKLMDSRESVSSTTSMPKTRDEEELRSGGSSSKDEIRAVHLNLTTHIFLEGEIRDIKTQLSPKILRIITVSQAMSIVLNSSVAPGARV
ncbi:Copia protein [Senna tora]|uniref:Copia protein n=1 Tax=Senna tora TaxID=362788 RepID=A0A834XET2_9FABA|nr:Copia protein [Senna tora]